MNKELEEAIKMFNDLEIDNDTEFEKARKIILNYIENSISKEKVEEYLKQEQKAFDTYKRESKTNENLKNGMWKHLGAKNMCERILGIEKVVTTLD